MIRNWIFLKLITENPKTAGYILIGLLAISVLVTIYLFKKKV